MSMERVAINPPGWRMPVRVPLSLAVRRGDVVYCSGQVGADPRTGAIVGASIRDQTRQTLLNIQEVLESAGSSLSKVDKCTVFLTRAEDFGAMNEVYQQFFASDPPARSTVVVAALARPEFVVEIECIAHISGPG